MALAPGFDLHVLGVARCLHLQAAVRHRTQVQLDEGEQAASIGLGDFDEGIGRDRPLLSTGPGGERLAGVGLALEASQLPLSRQRRLQRHIDLAEPSGMGEEERVRLAPLASSRRRASGNDRLASAGWPEVVRRRSPFAVGTAPAGEAVAGEPRAAVAERPGRRLGIESRRAGYGSAPGGWRGGRGCGDRGRRALGSVSRNGSEHGSRQGVRFGLASRGPLAAGGAVTSVVERSRCVASAEVIAKASRAKGASRCAAEGTRSRSTHRQLIASRVGRESGAGERRRSRDVMREQAGATLPVGVRPTGKVRAEIGCVKEAHGTEN